MTDEIAVKSVEINTIRYSEDLSEDQRRAFYNVLKFYNIDWKINLKDFKSMLTEIDQLNKNQTRGIFSQTINDILLKYRNLAYSQQIVETPHLQFS